MNVNIHKQGASLSILLAVGAVAACTAREPAPATRQTVQEIVSSNALQLNALQLNALQLNALQLNALQLNALQLNALQLNGLTSEEMTPAGVTRGALSRDLLKYIVSCALPQDKSLHLVLNGIDYGIFPGGVGLAPEWGEDGGSCDVTCQRWVSACLLARTNFWGVPIQISLRGNHPALEPSADEKTRFPLREGAYYGNLFEHGGIDHLYACAGPGSNVPQLTNRFCSGASGVCAIKVGHECRIESPPVAVTGQEDLAPTRYACQRQDPSDGAMLDCWTDGIPLFGDVAPQGKLFREVITVHLKEPVAICGDGVCTGVEDSQSCASDCHPGWARSFAGLFNAAEGLVQMPGGDVAVALLTSDTTDAGSGPIKVLSDEWALVLARFDASGNPRWSREIATAKRARLSIGGDPAPRGALLADADGNLTIAGFASDDTWFDDRLVPLTVGDDYPSGFFVAGYTADGAQRWAISRVGALRSFLLEPDGTPVVQVGIPDGGAFAVWLLAADKRDGTLSTLAEVPFELVGHGDRAVLFEPEGTVLFTSDEEPPARFDPARGTVARFEPLPIPARTFDIVPTPDGDLIAVAVSLAAGTFETYLVRYSKAGAIRWSRRITRSASQDEPGAAQPLGIRVNRDGEILVYGRFFGPVDFENDVLSPVGTHEDFIADIFVARYDAAGRKRWVRQLGGGGEDVAGAGLLDDSGDILLAGAFSQTGVFDGRILSNAMGGGEPTTYNGFILRMMDALTR